MADQKMQRKHLNDYTTAARVIEISGAAIVMLEQLGTTEAMQACRALHRGNRRQLKLLDAAAARLGAPYPHGVRAVPPANDRGVTPPLGTTKEGWLAHRKYEGLCRCDNCWQRYADANGVAVAPARSEWADPEKEPRFQPGEET